MHNRSKNRGNRALSEQPVLVEARPTYRIITLNRPNRLNAITVDLHRALRRLAEPISAEAAGDWGLIWKCVDDAGLMREAHAICERFGEAPTRSLAMIKRAFDASAHNTLDAQLDLERDLQREVGRGGDYLEGVTAFLEKRKPVYKGRA